MHRCSAYTLRNMTRTCCQWRIWGFWSSERVTNWPSQTEIRNHLGAPLRFRCSESQYYSLPPPAPFPAATPLRTLNSRRKISHSIPPRVCSVNYLVEIGVREPFMEPKVSVSSSQDIASALPEVCVCVCARASVRYLSSHPN